MASALMKALHGVGLGPVGDSGRNTRTSSVGFNLRYSIFKLTMLVVVAVVALLVKDVNGWTMNTQLSPGSYGVAADPNEKVAVSGWRAAP